MMNTKKINIFMCTALLTIQLTVMTEAIQFNSILANNCIQNSLHNTISLYQAQVAAATYAATPNLTLSNTNNNIRLNLPLSPNSGISPLSLVDTYPVDIQQLVYSVCTKENISTNNINPLPLLSPSIAHQKAHTNHFNQSSDNSSITTDDASWIASPITPMHIDKRNTPVPFNNHHILPLPPIYNNPLDFTSATNPMGSVPTLGQTNKRLYQSRTKTTHMSPNSSPLAPRSIAANTLSHPFFPHIQGRDTQQLRKKKTTSAFTKISNRDSSSLKAIVPNNLAPYLSDVDRKKTNTRKEFITHAKPKIYNCSYCPTKCASNNDWHRHMQLHNDTLPFVCNQCQKRFKDKDKLKKHLKNKHANKHANKHTNKHTIFRPSVTCFKKFEKEEQLKKHMRDNHTEKKLMHACKKCPAKFLWAHKLERHQQIHTGEAIVICPFCNAPFKNNSNLRAHLRN